LHVALYSRRRVHDVRSKEHRVDGLIIGSLSVPAVQRDDLLNATMVDSRQRLTHTRLPVAESDIAVTTACFAEFNEALVLERLHEHW